jgi:putative lipoprotein
MDHNSPRSPSHGKVIMVLMSAMVIGQLFLASQALAIGGDKYAHFSGGAGTGLAVDTVLYHFADKMGPARRIATGTAFSLVPGFIVEVVDEFTPRNSFSWGDLLADGLGAFTGVLAAELINGQLWVSASGRQIRLIGRW